MRDRFGLSVSLSHQVGQVKLDTSAPLRRVGQVIRVALAKLVWSGHSGRIAWAGLVGSG